MEDHPERLELSKEDAELSFRIVQDIGPEDDRPCTPPGTPPDRKRKRSQSPVSDQKRPREHSDHHRSRDMNSEHGSRRSSHSEHRHHSTDQDHRDYRPLRDNRRYDERRPEHEKYFEERRERFDDRRIDASRHEERSGVRGGNFEDRSRFYEKRSDAVGRFEDRGYEERRGNLKRDEPRIYNERRYGDDRRLDEKRNDGRRFPDTRRIEDDRGLVERRHPHNGIIEKSVYIGNLPYDIHRDELKRLCEKFGNVYAITLGAKGYGFVTMDERGAFIAVRELDGKLFDGRTLHVNEAFNEPKL
jgi:hypothetical protein